MTGNLVAIAEHLGFELTDSQRQALANLSVVYDAGPVQITAEPDTSDTKFRYRASQYIRFLLVDEPLIRAAAAWVARGPRPLSIDGHEYRRRQRARRRRA